MVVSKSSKPYQIFREQLKKTLANDSSIDISIDVIMIDELNQVFLDDVDSDSYKLLVTVGSKAAKKMSQLDSKKAVLNTLLPKRSYQLIIKEVDNKNLQRYSAVFIDQPLSRKLDLIRIALPDIKNVGVILGPSTASRKKELSDIALKKNIRIESKTINKTGELLSTLNDVLDDNEVLLTIADPVVINRSTLQSLFMTSYMKRIPVVGYSRAYVRAGALIAVYSTPKQLAQYTGELIVDMLKGSKMAARKLYYPKYFSVSINERVARSLGLFLKSESKIQSDMQLKEGGS
ncbi:MAG: hypothetical protein GXP13_09750 [Gammaproteobacteria bacterium]|nr:hypothetical protein [Gammaproteobacteria bacterium]